MAEPTDADYKLGQAHMDAELNVRRLEYQAAGLYRECQQKLEPVLNELEAARRVLMRLQPKYDAMMERLVDDEDEDDEI